MTATRTQFATIAITTDDSTKVIRLHQASNVREASGNPIAKTAMSNPAPLHSRTTSNVTVGRMMEVLFSSNTGMPSACKMATDMFAVRS